MNHSILKLPEVKKLTGLSRSSIYDFMQKGEFPKSIKLSARSVGWLQEEVNAWIDQKVSRARMLEDLHYG